MMLHPAHRASCRLAAVRAWRVAAVSPFLASRWIFHVGSGGISTLNSKLYAIFVKKRALLRAQKVRVVDGVYVLPAESEAKTALYEGLIAELRGFFAKYGPKIDAAAPATAADAASAASIARIARMATLNSFTCQALTHTNFVGFYMSAASGLIIGPYQGHVKATAFIVVGAGQCGTAAATKETTIAEDVSVCANYIACDDVTRSEIVLPVFAAGSTTDLIAVWDIDSEILAAFDAVDARYLEAILREFIV